MQGQRKSNNSSGGNPYVNNKVYPVASIITCSLFDSYINFTLKDFNNAMLPGDIRKGIKNIYMDEVYDEFKGLLDKLADVLQRLCKWMNRDDLAQLKKMYNIYKDTCLSNMDNKVIKANKKLTAFLKDHEEVTTSNINHIVNEPEVNKLEYIKLTFLEKVVRAMIEKNINREIQTYNSDIHKLSNFIVDSSDLYTVHRKNGIIFNEYIDEEPYLTDYEIDSLERFASDFFEKDYANNKNVNYIYLVHIHLLINIKGRPFMIINNLEKDKEAKKIVKDLPQSKKGKYGIFPSFVAINAFGYGNTEGEE